MSWDLLVVTHPFFIHGTITSSPISHVTFIWSVSKALTETLSTTACSTSYLYFRVLRLSALSSLHSHSQHIFTHHFPYHKTLRLSVLTQLPQFQLLYPTHSFSCVSDQILLPQIFIHILLFYTVEKEQWINCKKKTNAYMQYAVIRK